MSVAYRERARMPAVVVAERGRASAGLLALAALAMVLASVFATTARLTVSCTRARARAAGDELVTCYVEQAGAWARASRTTVFRAPQKVAIETHGSSHRVTVDGQLLLESELDEHALEHLAKSTATLDAMTYSNHALGHAGGWVVDLRVLVGCAVAAISLLLLSRRRHVVVLDHEREELLATTTLAFVPWTTRRVSVRRGDRVVARVDDGRAKLVLVGTRAPIVLLEDDAAALGIGRLAQRVDAVLPHRAET